jgi:hypothetical protein
MASYLSSVTDFVRLFSAPCAIVFNSACQVIGNLFRMNVFTSGPSFATIRQKLQAGSALTGPEIRFMERQSSFEIEPSDRSQYGQWKQKQFARLQEKIKEGECLTPIEDEEYEALSATHIFNAHDQEVFRKWERQVDPSLERRLEEAQQNKRRNKELAKPRSDEEGVVKRPNPSRKVRIVEPTTGIIGGFLSAFPVSYERRGG